MKNLEGVDSHIVLIDIEGLKSVKRIVNVYRIFNPQNNVNARAKFIYKSIDTFKIHCKKLYLSF